MNWLDSLTLENVVTYRGVHRISLSAHPVTIVRGRSLDDHPVNSNGAAKSLIFHALMDLLESEHPFAIERADNKTLQAGESSRIRLRAHNDVDSYVVDKIANNGKIKYRVEQNDQALKVREVKHARRYIERDIYPLNSNQTKSLVYLNSLKPSDLWLGKDSERHALFQQLFDLGIYDNIYDELRAELRELDREQMRHDALIESLLPLPDLKYWPKYAGERLKQWRREVAKWRDQVHDRQRRMDQIQTWLRLQEDIDPEAFKLDFKSAVRDAESDHQQAKDRYYQLRRAVDRYEDARKMRETRSKLERELDGIEDPRGSYDELDAKCRSAKAEREQLRKTIVEVTEHESDLTLLEMALSSMADKKILGPLPALGLERDYRVSDLLKDNQAQRILDRVRDQINLYLDQLEHLHDHKGACPTCGTELSGSERNRRLQQVRKDLEGLEHGKGLVEEVVKWAELNRKYGHLLPALKTRQEDRDRYEQLADRVGDLAQRMRRSRDVERITTQLKSLSDISDVDRPDGDLDQLSRRLDRAERHLDWVRKQESLVNQLNRMGVQFKSRGDAKLELDRLRRHIEQDQQSIDETDARIRRYESEQRAAEQALRQYRNARNELVFLRLRLKDRPVYQELARLYGPRGDLRVDTVDNIAQLYTQNLNQYASLIFCTKVRFWTEVEDRAFRIMVERDNGKISDVRQLSGAQGRQFSLLSLRSLLPMIPDRLRVNLVVLDEMEANMDEGPQRKYTDEFIPELSRIVPNIFIVTPQNSSDFYVSGAHELMVEKKDGCSRIIEQGATHGE